MNHISYVTAETLKLRPRAGCDHLTLCIPSLSSAGESSVPSEVYLKLTQSSKFKVKPKKLHFQFVLSPPLLYNKFN